jgi:hypothetical protein
MLNIGKGKVTPMKGLQLENPLTIPSDPFQDTLFIKYLEKQIKNPPIYRSLGNNCIFWSVAVLQIGMDYNIKDQIDGNVPIDDIHMPQSPPHGTPPRKNVQGEYRFQAQEKGNIMIIMLLMGNRLKFLIIQMLHTESRHQTMTIIHKLFFYREKRC